jgi:hypothetical protein
VGIRAGPDLGATPGGAELLQLMDATPVEDAHMGCSMQTKAWASDADQGIGQ